MKDNFSLYDTTDVVDIVLYKYNYNDNRVWTGIKNSVEYLRPNDSSVIVTKEQLENFIYSQFLDEINLFNSVGSEVLHKEVNSIFFMINMLKEMKHLRWIKLSLNKNSSYSRIVTDPAGLQTIKFGYKILHMTLKTFEVFDADELIIFNKVLHSQKILEEGIPYRRLKLNDLLDRLDEWLTKADKGTIRDLGDNDLDVIDTISIMLDMMGDPKIAGDNPEVLLVTDY
jgi:hypothetical protein